MPLFLELALDRPTRSTPEYKLLQLRQYLSGEALKVVEPLGHSATAKERFKKIKKDNRCLKLKISEEKLFRGKMCCVLIFFGIICFYSSKVAVGEFFRIVVNKKSAVLNYD